MRRVILVAVALATIGLLGSSAGATTIPLPTPSPSPSPPAIPDVVHYNFDGMAPLADVTGNGHDLSPVARHGGSLSTVAHAGGSALTFPEPCHDEPCPRIALRTVTSDDLNPGRRDIRFGASVLLAGNETTKGENVLQKGYSARGSQYKLQIDGAAGHPSCVLVDDEDPEIHVAMSTVGVADNRWHSLECRRAGSALIILVDGVRSGRTIVPPDLSIDNRIPLSVGGKGSFRDNDQFQGTLDDVWVQIAPLLGK
ncbi:LamG-like jellyroll fold domain-containing protein [Actinoplanes sp. NPDC026619]|uniref:LamG-like jellyroll fold domain-containing protein n=1 Tax=Actinoplanes sp. NPDC026619 TaxID=3155798 RepID=UPI0033D809DB